MDGDEETGTNGTPDGCNGQPETPAITAEALQREAIATNERRLLVLAGEKEQGYDSLESILSSLEVGITDTTLVGPENRLRCEHLSQSNADRMLGATRKIVIVDAHEGLRPNALGRVVGAVAGGGLLILLTPSLDEWPNRRGQFAESLAVPPFERDEVGSRFKERLVDTLHAHRGVAIVDLHDDRCVDDGLTGKIERAVGGTATEGTRVPPDRRFPSAAYEACLTQEQVEAVAAFEALLESQTGSESAVILESDRGRGKSSAAGLAAGCLAAEGLDVVVTAPSRRNASELFERANELLAVIDSSEIEPESYFETDTPHGSAGGACVGSEGGDGDSDDAEFGDSDGDETGYNQRDSDGDETGYNQRDSESGSGGTENGVNHHDRNENRAGDNCNVETTGNGFSLETSTGGRIRFEEPLKVTTSATLADIVLVEEAAAMPVATLSKLLDADRIGFATTIHGYEGSGRGFTVRFRDRLENAPHDVTDVRLTQPIRYAAGDPIEVWAFRALLLDARPAVSSLVEGADPETVEYRRLDPDTLLADEHLLREVFGLLVLAHYRTEPNDLARLLDAPNLDVRALLTDGHVVCVSLLAREGGLTRETRARTYEGGRLKGHMLPDILTSHLRDERAGSLTGVRVVRIATHHAIRRRGLASQLVTHVRENVGETVDWLGAGFGATPDLVDFWGANGFGAVHVSTTRNATSGEYSVVMLSPTSESGRALASRHASWFADRFRSVCGDSLRDVDPDVVRAVLRTVDASPRASLSDREWHVVAGAAYGPGLYDVDPDPFRKLVVQYLVDQQADGDGTLAPRQERLLVLRALCALQWETVADRLEYHSTRQCMRAFGEALQPLVDRYGTTVADSIRERFAVDE